jgi:hypothetical protein
MNFSLISIVLIAAVLCITPLKTEAQNDWKNYTVEGELTKAAFLIRHN